MQSTVKFKLPARIKKEAGRFVSCCPILDVWSQGETKDKALNNLNEALQLFFISCFERGTLVEVLKKCGFTLTKRRGAKPHPLPKRYESLEVSVPFQIPSKADPAEWRV
jgi:predicted RNase H-like HicB family nuclease